MDAVIYRPVPGSRPVTIHLRASQGARRGDNAADITWQINPILQCDPRREQFLLSFPAVSIANSFYNVTASTNRITWPGGAVTIDVTPGSYDIFQLATAINQAAAAVPYPVVVTASEITGKFTFAFGAIGANAPWLPGQSSMAPLIGFTTDFVVHANTTYPLQSPANLATRGTQIFIRSSTLHAQAFESQPGGNPTQVTDIVARVPIGDVNKWDFAQPDISEQVTPITDTVITAVNLRLTDRDGALFEFQEAYSDWNVSVKFTRVLLIDDEIDKRRRAE